MVKAAQILYEGRGKQWEPMIVDAFLRLLEKAHPQVELAPETTQAHSISMTKTLAEPAMASPTIA